MMAVLPDELWRRILEVGIETPNLLNCKDLCCLSITCRFLNRLSSEDHLWFALLSSDFPQIEPTISSSSSSSSSNNPSRNPSPKTLYRNSYEKDRARKLAAHRRVVLRIESQIAEHVRKMDETKVKSADETDKMKSANAELLNLRRVGQASAALNVWQPEVVRGRHKQLVEQCIVPVDSRIRAIEMEIRLCKQQIAGYDKAYRDEKKRLDGAKVQLESIKYHPLREPNVIIGRVDKFGIKRRKLEK